jgi:hypothetical protein
MLDIRTVRFDPAPSACRAFVILLTVCWLGCTGLPRLSVPLQVETKTVPGMGKAATMTPQGPGHIFASVEEAGVDALAYCNVETRRVERASGAWGGVCRAKGGFTHDEPFVAGSRLRYPLGPLDVAHFRHQPNRSTFGSQGSLSSLSKDARDFVDRRDPAMRPYFHLTPERSMRVYAGAESGSKTLARVAPGPRNSTQLEWRAATALAATSPMGPQIHAMALQPKAGAVPTR